MADTTVAVSAYGKKVNKQLEQACTISTMNSSSCLSLKLCADELLWSAKFDEAEKVLKSKTFDSVTHSSNLWVQKVYTEVRLAY